jgi:glycosyltransferase involved in cell wall biosynthesis
METAPGEMRGHVQVLNQLFRRGDFFICASERQRAFWLDCLVRNGRISASAAADPKMRALIDVVPFGIDPTPPPSPTNDRFFLNAAVPSLGREKIIVWPGGMWDWTDPQIVLSAMRILGRRAAGIQLLFFAGTHPTEGHFETSALKEARALAREFQLQGRSVHFIDDYVPYGERGRYLVECDAAVSTHRANLESHYAYRTRLLDCIWADLPIVCTEGDVLADMVTRNGFGIVVPPRDAAALAAAIERISTDRAFAASCRVRIVESRHLFDWNDAIEPLVRFCDQPRVTHLAAPAGNAGLLAGSAWRVFKTHGARETFRRLKQHLRSR